MQTFISLVLDKHQGATPECLGMTSFASASGTQVCSFILCNGPRPVAMSTTLDAGVKASPLLGMSMSQFTGIQLFSRNVFICNDRKTFKALAQAGFAKLAEETYAQQASASGLVGEQRAQGQLCT